MYRLIFLFKFSELDWSFIEEYVEAFKPLSQCTVIVQNLQFTLSDFYKEWVEAYGKTTDLRKENRFKALILAAMDERQRKLFTNHALKAAVYCDPRFTFNGSSLFSASQKDEILVSLFINLRISDKQ